MTKFIIVCAAVALSMTSHIVWPRTFNDGEIIAGQKPAERRGIEEFKLQLRADKEEYILGEMVVLNIRVINASDQDEWIEEDADVWSGRMKVLISYENGEYSIYMGPQWGLQDAIGVRSVKVRPGGAVETEATVLYNQPMGSKEFLEREYAFDASGRYHVKARLYDAKYEQKIESEPVGITINEPQGVDREVWNVIKEEPEYAYFLQTGGVRGSGTLSQQKKQLVSEFEEIVTLYPESSYMKPIREGIKKHYKKIEKRKKNGRVQEDE